MKWKTPTKHVIYAKYQGQNVIVLAITIENFAGNENTFLKLLPNHQR